MLKTTIDNNQNIDISKYTQLSRFIKRQNVGFQSKKSKVLTSEQVEQFLREAADTDHLATKVKRHLTDTLHRQTSIKYETTFSVLISRLL